MKIAFISAPGKGETDRLLTEAAQALEARGLTLSGIVKDESHDSRFANGCDMKVRVLSDHSIIQITQDLGSGSNACRLNPTAIAEAVARVEASDMAKADFFLLNKFGPEEAEGRGFVSAISKALELDIPVLVGVSPANRAAFDSFAGGLAVELPNDANEIHIWCMNAQGEIDKLSAE